MTKSELLFYYQSRQNPNGDPDADNQPRLMHDGTIMVTDVRIKRTIRDYAKEKYDYTLFVDFADDGLPTTADKRVQEIADNEKDKSDDYIEILLKYTFDVPLFGGLVTIRNDKDDSKKLTGSTKIKKNKKDNSKGGSQKLTGPVQFGIGRSINPVNIISPAITARFIGDKSKGRQTTIGRFFSVEYALIKTFGAINPTNLNDYLSNADIKEKFMKYCDELPLILWDGTNQLVTRSKYPQNSVLFIQVDYKDTLYNDLSELIHESEEFQNDNIQALVTSPFDFTSLVSTLNARKNKIEKIRIKCIDDIQKDVSDMLDNLEGIKIDKL